MLSKKIFLLCTILVVITSGAAEAGVKHNDKHIIGLNQFLVDGRLMNIQPGDTLCIEAGRRPFLRFENITGSPEKPVIIINCGGKVTLGGPAVNNGILFLRSRYFRLTGSGHPDHSYGFHIVETKEGSQGVAITLFSSDAEVDHLEIEKAGFAGIMAKTDPLCDGSADRGNFTMHNVHLHHNYIHDVKGEGIYLGNSFYTGTKVYCDTFHLPHEVKGVRVHHNRLENTGWDAIQVGSATEDSEIFNNYIRNFGTGQKHAQNNGIQAGLGTTGRIYNNTIHTGSGSAIVIQGTGDNYVYNNLIIAPGQEAFNINTREPKAGKGVYIINNTIANAKNGVIKEYVNPAKNNVFINNLMTGCNSGWNMLKPYTHWKLENNLAGDSHSLKFEDASQEDFRPLPGNHAIDAGKDVSDYHIHTDILGKPRPGGKGYDIGAFEMESSL